MKTTIAILGLVVVSGLMVFFLSLESGPSQQETSQNSSANGTFSLPLQSADGTTVTVDSFLHDNRVVVVNSWATWCPFCVKELPDFVRLQESFPDDIYVIAINRREAAHGVSAYLNDLGVDGKLRFLYDPRDDWYRQNGGFTMPETMFIAANGEVVLHKRGFMTLEEMTEHVENALAASK